MVSSIITRRELSATRKRSRNGLVGSANARSQLSTTRKYGPPRHDEPELVLRFASPIPVCFGLCARSVLNLHDRIQGSPVAARLTVGESEVLDLGVYVISCVPTVCDFFVRWYLRDPSAPEVG